MRYTPEGLKTNNSPNIKRGVRAMNGGEHSEEKLYASLRMSGTEYILTRGDLSQYNEIDAASEVS